MADETAVFQPSVDHVDSDLNEESLWILCSPRGTKKLKLALENSSLYDNSRKITNQHIDTKRMAIPVKTNLHNALQTNNDLKALIDNLSAKIELINDLSTTSKNNRITPRDVLIQNLRKLFHQNGLVMSDDLIREVPKSWDKHGDLVLLPEMCFTSEDWVQFGEELWVLVAHALGANRIGKKSCIIDNDYRSPRVNLLYGESGWVSHIDNGISYTYDVTKCMFSSGNITEKIRVGHFDCAGQTVVDLYAGIGYFVLPYLVKAKARLVYACEWNPDAAQALRRNLELNGMQGKCIVIQGDNRKFPYSDIADHVNLGLIPSSEAAWPVACAALNKNVGGWLHVHGNVTSLGTDTSEDNTTQDQPTCNRKIKQAWLEWSKYTIREIQRLLEKQSLNSDCAMWDVQVKHIEHVKAYAPHVDHLVLDIKCQPVT